MTTGPEIPPILQGVTSRSMKLRFWYTFPDGTRAEIQGTPEGRITHGGIIVGLTVMIGSDLAWKLREQPPVTAAITAPGAGSLTRYPVKLRLDSIEPNDITETIIAPDWRSTPRRQEPTERQVAYALDLAEKWEDEGTSLYPGMTRQRLQAMTRQEVSDFIGIARSEMGLEEL